MKMFPWVNCCLIPFKIVPDPADDDAFCKGEVAKISPNSALLLLSCCCYVSILFEVAEISACDPLSPVKRCKMTSLISLVL